MRWIPKFRYSMRTLMIVTAVICVMLSPIGMRLYKAQQQQQVIAWVLENRGRVSYTYSERIFTINYSEGSAGKSQSLTPIWLQNIFGEHFFDQVECVEFGPDDGIVFCTFGYPIDYFASKPLSDISPLAKLDNLKLLNLSNTQVTDLSSLVHHPHLEKLILSDTLVSDISAVKHLKKLKALTLSRTNITNLSALGELNQLTRLEIRETKVANLSPLAQHVNMKILHITDSLVSDLTPLSKMVRLKRFHLDNTPVDDLSALSNMQELEYLMLWHTQVTDISPLEELQGLLELKMDNTKVSDLSPLLANKNLYWIDYNSAIVPVQQVIELQAALPECVFRFTPNVETP